MTLEKTLSNVALEAAKHADLANQLIEDVKDGIDTIEVVSQNHSVMDDWRTKTGKVAFKDLAGNTHQVDTLATIIADAEKINPNPHVMTKAQFDALRDIRKKQYAGSGFVEWGKCYQPEGRWSPKWINNGLYQSALSTGYTNELLMGSQGTSPQGVSNTDYPESVIDGVTHKLSLINSSNLDLMNRIKFPAAPDGTKTYDSATGIVTEHASAAEAFEGLVTNGDFRNGSTGWILAGWRVENGKATRSGISSNSDIKQSFNVTAGVTYEISYFREHTGGNPQTNIFSDLRTGAGYLTLGNSTSLEPVKITDTFTPTSSGSVQLRIFGIGDFEGTLSNISVRPVTESVITSRKDLVFLESWHEKIADKDVVYPLGNVQYGANSYDGIGLLNNLVAQGYSAFGEWDADTTGHGAKWSSLSETNRAKLLANPAHNIYYDPEVKAYIQVRYRIRVVEGLGDEWGNIKSINDDLRYGPGVTAMVKPHGMLTSLTQDISTDSGGDGYGIYTWSDRDWGGHTRRGKDPSTFNASNSDGKFGYRNKCFAMPIALVQRMNQGAYHPSYNPMGCSTFISSGGDATVHWYDEKLNEPSRTSDCFNVATGVYPFTRGVAYGDSNRDFSGKLKQAHVNGSGITGRSDQYKFYDAIYAGQVEDLRLNANKLDMIQLREESIRKAVTGEMRGKGKVPFTVFNQGKCLSSGYAIYIHSIDSLSTLIGEGTYYNARKYISALENGAIFEGASIAIKFTDAGDTDLASYAGGVQLNEWLYLNKFQIMNSKSHIGCINPNTGNNNWFSTGAAQTISAEILMPTENETAEFDSLPWVDIFGNPERIAATFPNGVVGQWIPHIPVDGGNVVNLNKKCSTTTAVGNFTFNDGATWGTHPTFPVNSRTNSRTGWSDSNGSKIVYIISYETHSNFTEPSNSSVVVGGVGNVYATQSRLVDYGNRLQASLTGNIGKREGGAYLQEYVPVTKHTNYAPAGTLGWTSAIGDEPLHTPLSLDTPNDSSPAVKALSTVTEKDGLLYFQLHGAELKYTARTTANMTVINAGSPTGSITKGKVYLFKGFDNALINRPIIAIENHVGTTWRKHDFDGYTINSTGQVIDHGNVNGLLRAFESRWGDDQVIPIVSGEDVKTDLNGNTVKVFCHHTQIPIGIAHHG
ncbi:hypothetical protein CWB96_19190 [Pseudoalteromonas citrea]|uniref:Uncharacterized protein n=1 Tax=Pseudoalteromonas citrea TaxID=43655 RepID=A0A5S3XJK0_9GAMM|nr:hypothetical protein [Pseudoalteromonas citrea]TMP46408.1 hypothetical protein CWB97_02005 [Pseudoalteromonas citrea]TMP54494.1 hypothetical protein CWB96_19190 [Pseudoalteromonas citrea]